jgi:hypothetical protein
MWFTSALSSDAFGRQTPLSTNSFNMLLESATIFLGISRTLLKKNELCAKGFKEAL